MATSITVKIILGGLVQMEIDGEDATEIAESLKGWKEMNQRIDEVASDLAIRVYPEESAKHGGDKSADQAKEK